MRMGGEKMEIEVAHRVRPDAVGKSQIKENSIFLDNQSRPGNNIPRQQHGSHNTLDGQYNGNNRIQDKSLQELRAFALEYVKQIVAKASELSQERQEAKNAQKLAQFYTGASYGSPQTNNTNSNNNNNSKNRQPFLNPQAVKEAAIQINNKFQINQMIQTSNNNNNNNRSFHQPNSGTTFSVAGSGAAGRVQVFDDEIERLKPGGQDSRVCRAANDDDQDEDDGDGDTICTSQTASNNKMKKSKKREKKRGLHQRLNWHLLISCFSTCLPQTLADTFPSSSGLHSSKVDPTAL